MTSNRKSNLSIPIALLLVTILAYGLLIPWLGLYSDDWLFLWIGQKLGPAGLARYFATNRPFWGLLYQLTMSLFGSAPIVWHIFALLSRWLNALAAWVLLSQIWPAERRRAALWAALLLLLYPGYKLQPIAITFGHLFLVLTIFLFSLACSLLAERKPAWALPYTLVGLLLCAANLLMMEYFFVLELLRPLLIFLVTHDRSLRVRLGRTFIHWLPYLIVFLAVTIWRAFFFKYQTHLYPMTLVSQFKSAPFSALGTLLITFTRDLLVAVVTGWANAFTQLPVHGVSTSIRLAWAALVAVTSLAIFVFLLALQRRSSQRNDTALTGEDSNSIPAILVFSAAWLTLAGLPFLLTGLRVEADWIYSRFTIPYILGSALLIVALLAGLQNRFPKRGWIAVLVVSLLAGLSAGNQFLNANRFRADWGAQQALYWQMAWRIPGLKPGTTLLINEQNTYAGSPTYLTAAINWFYAPSESGQRALYQVLFTREALMDISSTDQLSSDYLGGVFTGRSQDVVVLVYNGRCLHVLDPQVDSVNPSLDSFSARAAALSRPEQIDTTGTPAQRFIPDPVLLGQEPARGWCYWAAQAELAAQAGDWAAVVRIGDGQIRTAEISYKTVVTYLPFIEAYAHLDRWQKALELSDQVEQVITGNRAPDSPTAAPLLCKLWQRIAVQTKSSAEKDSALGQVRQKYTCAP